MKLDQLRKIIREEVKAAVKEELQEMLNEAVKIASSPNKMQPAPKAGQTSWSAPVKQQPVQISGDPIMEMLNQTRASMTGEEYKNIVTATSDMVVKPNFQSAGIDTEAVFSGPQPGIDISKLDFVSKAKAVLDASNKKDKERFGV